MNLPARATNVRPGNATLVYSFSLTRNRWASWGLNCGGLLLLLPFGWLFSWLVLQLRPEAGFKVATTSSNVLPVLLSILGITAGVTILHEVVHGVFFWIFTRKRPVFGLRGSYAFAAAPGWYFPRWQYVMIGLAPFTIITLLGFLLLVVLPSGALAGLLLGMVMNAAGAVGDFWIVLMALRERRRIIIEDLGDGFNFYALE